MDQSAFPALLLVGSRILRLAKPKANLRLVDCPELCGKREGSSVVEIEVLVEDPEKEARPAANAREI